MQEDAFFVGFIIFFLWVLTAAFVIYIGARLAHIEGRSLWRAFFASLTSAFVTSIVVSMSQDSLRTSLLYWVGVYAAIAALVIKPVLRTTLRRAAVSWLLSLVLVAVEFLVWHFFFGVPSIG